MLNGLESTYALALSIQISSNAPGPHPCSAWMGSRRMFHTRVKAASRIGPHNLDVLSVVIGSLLGDCYANRRSVEGTRLCYRQSAIHKDYLF